MSALFTLLIESYLSSLLFEETSVYIAISDFIDVLGSNAPAFCFLVVGDMLYMEVLLFVRLNLVLIGFRVPWSSLSSAALVVMNERLGFNWASCAGPLNWKFDGELLDERRRRYEDGNY